MVKAATPITLVPTGVVVPGPASVTVPTNSSPGTKGSGGVSG